MATIEATVKEAPAADAPIGDVGSLVCFACSRCDYPLCVSADIVRHRVPGGTTDYAFEYDLDFLLDLEEPVPCYSGNEVVQTFIRVSEKMLDQHMPSAARVVALEAIVASRQFEDAQKRQMEALLHVPDATSAVAPAADERRAEASPSAVVAATGHEHDQRLAASVEAPVARVAATGELVEADEQDERQDEEDAIPSTATTAVTETATTTSPATATRRSSEAGTNVAARVSRMPLFQRLNAPIRHLGATSESRVDLVCVRARLLASGLRLSLEDRSGDNPEVFTEAAAAVATASAEDARRQAALRVESLRTLDSSVSVPATTRASDHAAAASIAPAHVPNRDSSINASLDQVPAAVREAVLKPAPATRWCDAPGNLSVEEAFMTVTRTTHTAQAPWFRAYTCARRVECPDCHLPLGFLFVRRSSGNEETEADEEDEAKQRDEDETTEDGERIAKKAKRQCVQPEAVRDDDGDGMGSFIALELKRLKQREWGLTDFQARYEKAQHLDTFRALFPEAEELQSLYSRLTALRTQAELYSNLLRKHREQNDVQTALLQSQKQRMSTYEEKLSTMQQIIDAQRRQLEMQGSQLQHQQELLRSHRQQLNSQQQQIEVEQLLIAEQTKTIETQREQIKLMRAHLNTRRLQDQIAEKKVELAERMHQAYPHGTLAMVAAGGEGGPDTDTHSIGAEETNHVGSRISPAVVPVASDGASAASPRSAGPPSTGGPPAHLRGIRDQGQASQTKVVNTAHGSAPWRRWPPREDALGDGGAENTQTSEMSATAAKKSEEEKN